MIRLPVFSLVLLVLCAPRAHAQLLFNLDAAGMTGAPGDTLHFLASLTNAGASTVWLNGVQDSSPLELTIDSDPFFNNTPLYLLSGDTWSGETFDVTIDPGAPRASYVGSFSIVGGADGNALDPLATQYFQVQVTPEGGPIAMLTAAALPLAYPIRRRAAARRRA